MHPVYKKGRVAAVLLALLGLLLVVAGCDKLRKTPRFEETGTRKARKVSRQLEPGLQYLKDWEAMEPSVQRSLEYVSRKDPLALAVDQPGARLTWRDLARSLSELIDLLPRLEEKPELLAERFTWVQLQPEVLLTGYFEPLIEASLEPLPGYPHPIYGYPKDLLRVDLGKFHPRWEGESLLYRIEDGRIRPFFDREAIDFQEALSGRGLEIAWAKDLVDVFFLQIQGSGKLLLPDGTTSHILYNGKNGREYVSLGRIMIEREYLARENVSMQSIRRVLSENPELIPELLSTNPSYVFFRLGEEGPFGSMNKLLTPFVSVATDHTLLPPGAMAVVETNLPSPLQEEGRPWKGIVLAQDAGGAIKNLRMDLFCGSGSNAEYIAGHLQSEATVHMLVSKEVYAKEE